MSPTDLKEYLAVLRDAKVMSAHLKVPHGEITVAFGPEPLDVGEAPQAGGWKGPANLDAAFEPEEQLP